MAVDGSRWQVSGRAARRLAPGDAIDNECSRWLTMPGSLSTACESTMVSCRGGPAHPRRAISHEPASPIGFLSRCRRPCSALRAQYRRFVRCGDGCPGILEPVAPLQDISRALPRFATLSNQVARDSDVSLWPDSGRKIFSKITPGDELRAWTVPGRHRIHMLNQ